VSVINEHKPVRNLLNHDFKEMIILQRLFTYDNCMVELRQGVKSRSSCSVIIQNNQPAMCFAEFPHSSRSSLVISSFGNRLRITCVGIDWR
jgi:hypothetical protein